MEPSCYPVGCWWGWQLYLGWLLQIEHAYISLFELIVIDFFKSQCIHVIQYTANQTSNYSMTIKKNKIKIKKK